MNQMQMQMLMLKAQVTGLVEQIKELKQIPCSVCKGATKIERPDEDNPELSYIELCEHCNGNGYECGEYKYSNDTWNTQI